MLFKIYYGKAVSEEYFAIKSSNEFDGKYLNFNSQYVGFRIQHWSYTGKCMQYMYNTKTLPFKQDIAWIWLLLDKFHLAAYQLFISVRRGKYFVLLNKYSSYMSRITYN